MIVVIGDLGLRGTVDEPVPDGLAPAIACAAASAGSRVELISKAGDDPAGDAVLLALARAGVGHVATLRDPARPTPVRPPTAEPTDPVPATDEERSADDGGIRDGGIGDDLPGERPSAPPPDDPSTGAPPMLDAADIALALRYLGEYEVLVVVHPAPDLLAEAVSAAGWTGARLVVVVEAEGDVPPGVPADALVVAARADDADGVAARVGRYAAALSRGDDAGAAYRDLTAAPST